MRGSKHPPSYDCMVRRCLGCSLKRTFPSFRSMVTSDIRTERQATRAANPCRLTPQAQTSQLIGKEQSYHWYFPGYWCYQYGSSSPSLGRGALCLAFSLHIRVVQPIADFLHVGKRMRNSDAEKFPGIPCGRTSWQIPSKIPPAGMRDTYVSGSKDASVL